MVVHAVSECWPYARSGGLGEAVRGIAQHQALAGFPTHIVIPLYRGIRERFELEPRTDPFPVSVGRHHHTVRIFTATGTTDAADVHFVECDPLFDRAGLYGDHLGDFADNPLRFVVYARAVLELLPALSRDPPVLHVHDWHAAPSAAQLRTELADDPWYSQVPIVLTVHNVGYQGEYDLSILGDLGLPQDGRLEWKGRANFLKGALVYSDIVTTVSPTHADELCTDMGGSGLDPMFAALGDRLVGILNGIDYRVWDPSHDPEIAARYDAEDLTGRRDDREALRNEYALPHEPDVPIFAMTARLARQKGFDIILASGIVGEQGMQWIFLGEGEERYRRALSDLARRHPRRVATCFDFSESREHRLLAGADFLVMPSLYEPCGLTQMRAQRYGALPVARRVGGLADTVEDGVSGFLFDEYSPEAFAETVERARVAWADRAQLQEAMRDAMHRDFSWEASVIQYQAVYQRAGTVREGAGTP